MNEIDIQTLLDLHQPLSQVGGTWCNVCGFTYENECMTYRLAFVLDLALEDLEAERQSIQAIKELAPYVDAGVISWNMVERTINDVL